MKWTRSVVIIGIVASGLWLTGCAAPSSGSISVPGVTLQPTSPLIAEQAEDIPTVAVISADLEQPDALLPPQTPVYGYTNQRADGNRWVAGSGALPDSDPINLPLGQLPVWVAGVPANTGALWAVVLRDGSVRAFHVQVDGVVENMDITPDEWPADAPPLLRWSADGLQLVTAPFDDASSLTHPVPLSDGDLAYVADDGALVLWDGSEAKRLTVNAIPDARLLADSQGRILLLAGATTRYAHGIAGDEVEGGSITLVETRPEPRVILNIDIPAPRVVEGVAPIWVDLDGDGAREIIVTLSDGEEGAQIVVFDEQGQQIATGPSVGLGGRWRHQIAVAAFTPDGALSLAEVLTPHIGGITGFYRLEGDQLVIDATANGYTSHVIRTRNLDMAAAGDFDGDGRPEVLLPTQALDALGAIRWDDDGAQIVWTLPLEGQLATNIGAVTLSDGRISLAVGMDTGVLRIWGP